MYVGEHTYIGIHAHINTHTHIKSKYQINFQNFFLTAVLNCNALLINNSEKGKA